MLVVGYLFILMAGFFVNGSDYAFVLMMVIVFLRSEERRVGKEC